MNQLTVLRRFGYGLLAAGASLSLLAACGSSNSSAAGGSAPSAPSGSTAAAAGVDATIRNMFPSDILSRGTLNVGDSIPNPPMTVQDNGKLTGIDVDLYDAIGALAGLKINMTSTTLASVLPALQSGTIDTTGELLPNSDRTKVASFVLMFKVPFGILVPKDQSANVHSVSDLCGKTVALVQGSTPPQEIVAARQSVCSSGGKPAIKTHMYPDSSSAVLAVQSGAADAYVQAQNVTQYISQTSGGGNTFASVSDLQGLDGTVYFADGFGVLPTDTQLLKAMQAAMQKLIDNGTYADILKKYGDGENAITKATINTLDPADAAAPTASKSN